MANAFTALATTALVIEGGDFVAVKLVLPGKRGPDTDTPKSKTGAEFINSMRLPPGKDGGNITPTN